MAKPRSKARSLAEYALVRAALGIFRTLPTALVFRIVDALGELAYRFDTKHRLVAEKNIARVFAGELDEEAVRRLTRQVFRNFLRVGAELALLPDLLARRGLDDVIEVKGAEHVREAYAGGKGVIVYSAHLGNWEAIAAVGEPLGMRLHSVGRALDNPYLDRLLVAHRSRYARSVVPKEGGLRRIVQLLREGCGVAMLLDQHAGSQGILVPFLGRPAATFRAPAEIAWKFGLPILGGFGVRVDGSPRFRLEFQEVLWPDSSRPREDEVLRLTQAISDRIAEYVRRYPEQWNWLHRRWRDGSVKPESNAAAPRAIAPGDARPSETSV
jgi:KDO2-lipid IV(A) lauroyltransferase